MSFQLSDEESTDSESGIRFKTDSTRKPQENISYRKASDIYSKRKSDEDSFRNSRKSYSPWSDRRHSRRSRERSRDRLHNRSRDRSSERSYSAEDRHSKDRYGESYSSHKKKHRSDSRERRKHHKSRRKEEGHTSIDDPRYKEESSRKFSDTDSYRYKRSIDDRYVDKDNKTSKHREKIEKYQPEINPVNAETTSIEIIDSDSSSHEDSSYTLQKTYVKTDRTQKEQSSCNPVLQKIDVSQSAQKISVIKNKKQASHYDKDSPKKKIKNDQISFGPILPSSSAKFEVKTSEEKEIIPEIIDSNEENENSDSFGPALPTHLQKKSIKETNNDIDSVSSVESCTFGPTLPPHLKKNSSETSCNINNTTGPQLPTKPVDTNEENLSFGPSLPPHLQKKNNEESTVDVFGPVLPPHLQNKPTSDDESSFGPALPPHIKKPSSEKVEGNIIGPSIPSHLREILRNAESTVIEQNNSDSDDEMIGPVPEGHSSSISHKLLEERALEIRLNSLNPSESKQIVREEWMTELPAVKSLTSLGVTARQFRAKEGPDMSDRSSWTDTPQDKEKKKQNKAVEIDIKRQAELDHIAKRDKEQTDIVSKHKKKKKRDKALIELHREKLKKKVWIFILL